MQKQIISIMLLSSVFTGISMIPNSSLVQQAKLKFEPKILSEVMAEEEPEKVVPGEGRTDKKNEPEPSNTKSVNEFVGEA